MNSRAIVIAIVALFALCFVGSAAVMTLVLVERMATGQKTLPDKQGKDAPPVDDNRDVEPAPEATLSDPDDDELIETLEDSTRTERAANYEAPTVGESEFAVFYAKAPRTPPLPALQKLVKGTPFKVYAGKAPARAKPPFFVLQQETTLDYAVVEGQAIERARGLSDDEKESLPLAKAVAVVQVITHVSAVEQRDAARFIARFAAATSGTVWDELTQEYFSPDELLKRRTEDWQGNVPWAQLHFTVFVDEPDRGGLEFATAGLRRFGLPELELRGVPRNSRSVGFSLVNVVAQLLVESIDDEVIPGRYPVDLSRLKHAGYRKYVEDSLLDGAEQKATLELRPIGDGEIPSLEITFPGSGSQSVRVERGTAALFGAKDSVNHIQHDEELEQLSKSQMAEFQKTVKPRFVKGLETGAVLLVKAPFKTSAGGREWMWVEVSRISANGNITGLLANDPEDVPGLESGAEVVVKEGELFDWILKGADGTSAGNKTGELIQKRMAK